MILSINGRMLITAGIVLIGFLGITGVILEKSFRFSTEESFKERLQVHASALIASAEQEKDGSIVLAYALPESRFFTVGSGLYAKILSNSGAVQWSSPSMEGINIVSPGGLRRAEDRYEYLVTSEGEPVLSYNIGVTWGEYEKFKEGYTFVVAESLYRYNNQLHQFRNNLWGWLGGITVVLLAMLTLILRWGLSPLRKVATDLREIEAGRHIVLEGDYPKELLGLTDNLNALIRTNREHEARYRASLGDLAHSLKTPLAVLRGAVESPQHSLAELRSTVDEQVERMDQIVQYQLQRAATAGRTALTTPVNLSAVVNKVVKALDKVYAGKRVECSVMIEPGLIAHCDEADLMELFGNLVDNAYKWCQSRVAISVRNERGLMHQLVIVIADDGPGIAEEDIARVLRRGERLDQSKDGHGLGLSLVRDIVSLYQGELNIGRSRWGGAEIRLVL